MAVHYQVDGPICIVTIDRPEARNAVDRATAVELVEAFHRFDADDARSIAILTGTGGAFCAGADLKALAAGGSYRMAPGEEGPLGPTRLRLSKPVIAAVEGHAVAGWNWRCGATCAWRRVTQCSASSAGAGACR